jgi:hypothetical protein
MIDFSLIILCKEKSHLLPLTLDTLKFQEGAFEVLLLNGEKGGSLSDLVHSYPDLKLRIQNSSSRSLSEMMNEALRLARGQYVQFLEPGDCYISQHGLQFLSTLIEKKPHLIYANAFGKEQLADFITARSPWFLKEKLLALGGFDPLLKTCASMDLLCRLFQDKNRHVLFCRRVFLNTDIHKTVPIRETCWILYRHFGLWQAIRWVFFQDQSRWLRRSLAFFKRAFWNETA